MNPFLGEIRAFGFNFAPRGLGCINGQLLSISQNTALFAILGTTYGGDGKSNFALPDIEGRVLVHQGSGPGLSTYDLGETAGEDSLVLLQSELPNHVHQAQAVAAKGTSASPTGTVWAEASAARAPLDAYSDVTTSPLALSPEAVAAAGGNQPHENRPPLLVITYCIATQGVFPARN